MTTDSKIVLGGVAFLALVAAQVVFDLPRLIYAVLFIPLCLALVYWTGK